MNPETFFDNFGMLADTPNGVQKLRVLILQLAFKGKLINNRQKRNMTDHGGDLLTGWQQRTIGDLSKAIMPGFACNKSFQMTDGHVHLRTHNIDTNGKLNFDLLVKIDHKKVDMKKAQIHKGDIIFNNTNSQELVGKTCIVDQDYFYGFSNHLTLIKVIDEVEPAYIVYYFNLLLHIGYFAELCNRWIGQAGINTKMLKSILIPLPPLEEQKRIVTKVDHIMALCDELESRQQKKQEARLHLNSAALDRLLTAHEPDEFAHHWQRVCDNFDLLYDNPETVGELRKAILQLAVQGKLVRQDANDEPAAVLLKKIRVENERIIKEKNEKKFKSPKPVEENDAPYELAIEWCWARLPEVVIPDKNSIKRGPFGSTIRKDFFVPEGYKVYEQKNAIYNDFKLGSYYLDEKKFNELRDFEVTPNDIIISCSGTVGKSAIAPKNIEKGIINQALLKLSLNNDAIINEYFLILFPAFLMNTTTLTDLKGTAIKNIVSVKILKQMPFPLPPLQEQHRIVAKVDQLMALCDELEAKLKQSQTDGEKLMESVVHQLVAT